MLLDSHAAFQLARVRAAEAEVRALAEAGYLDADTARVVAETLERRGRLLQGLSPDSPTMAGLSKPELHVISRAFPVPVATAKPESLSPPNPPRSDEDVLASAAAPDQDLASAALTVTEETSPSLSPRRGSLLAGFMEERNILWGELVGGLLIVGCSIALVVTLWNRLEAIPYFPFLLSVAVTLALYGAGQYTLHHWKLESTSRGLLVISLLLAPLNLLLLSDPIMRSQVALPIDVGIKLGAVALFAWVVRGGGRDVLFARPAWRWPLAIAVIGAPASQLLPAAWFADSFPTTPAWLALACFAVAVAIPLRGAERRDESQFDRIAGAALLHFIGLASFGLATAWGLYIARAADVADRVRSLALPLALVAMPVIEAGLLVQRRILSGGLRVTGTGVALAGFAILTGGLAVAWPAPLSLLLVSLAAGQFLTRVAFRELLPWAQIGAIPAFAFAVVVGYHGIAGRWEESLSGLLGSADTGVVLAVFAFILAGTAEFLARHVSRLHALSYGLGAVAVGLAGLLVSSVNGPEFPIRAAAAHAICAIGLLASNARWRLQVVAHGGLWLVLIASLWGMYAAYPADLARWGFAVSLESLAFAGLALVLKYYPGVATSLLSRAGRDVSVAAAILAPALAVCTAHFLESSWHSGTLFTLAVTGLLQARLTGAPVATYLGVASAFLGVVHLSAFTLRYEPFARSLLIGVLALATVTTLLAAFLRRQERVFAYPFRLSTTILSVIAGLLLILPPAAHAPLWAGCAVWLGVLWLALALIWRERGAFSVFQIALSLAAVLIGVAWVNAQEWRPAKSAGFFEPAALHAYAVSLGILGIVWVVARRLLRHNTVARALWVTELWSAERVILAAIVLAQFLLAAWAILPEVKAEMTPADGKLYRLWPAELAQAFGSGAWILLGVLIPTTLASWRLTGNTHDTDPHLAGLALLFLTMPILWAGSNIADIAAATALRWGLGLAFVFGTAAVASREPLRSGLARAGFPVRTSPFTRIWLLSFLVVAAGVVVLISAQVAELGLSGRKPSGPVAGTLFAPMGAVVSMLVPLVLVVLGLAGTAARERSSGYAFASGMVFIATLAAGYALSVVSADHQLDGTVQVQIWLLLCGGAAAWALAWLASEEGVPGGLPLAIQSRLGLFGLALIALIFAFKLITKPDSGLTTSGAELGRNGWLALILATGAMVWRSLRIEPRLRHHALTLTVTIAAVLIACAMQPWDGEGKWLSFHTLAIVWAAVGVELVVVARMRGEASPWLDGFAGALLVLALRGAWADPWKPWLPAGLAAVASLVAGTSAVLNRSLVRVAMSGLLINLAAVLLWLPAEAQTTSGLLLVNAAGLAVAAVVWTVVAIRVGSAEWRDLTDFARGVSIVLLGFGLAPTLAGDRVDSHLLTWGATLAVLVSMVAALWDARAMIASGGLFAAGVAAVLLGVSELTVRPIWEVWQTPVALAVFALLASWLSIRVVRAAHPFLHLPERGGSLSWLVIAQGLISAAVLILGVRIGLTAPELEERLASPTSTLLITLAAALLIRALPSWASILRFAVIVFVLLVFATSAWAVPDPFGVARRLQRNAWLLVTLAAGGVVGSELARRFGENWRPAARAVGGIAAASRWSPFASTSCNKCRCTTR